MGLQNKTKRYKGTKKSQVTGHKAQAESTKPPRTVPSTWDLRGRQGAEVPVLRAEGPGAQIGQPSEATLAFGGRTAWVD